jgi:hypothetical protein
MANKKDTVKEEEKVTIIIPKPINVTGDTETIVSVNGVMYQIQYDKPVTVPANVAAVISSSMKLQEKIQNETENAVLRNGKGALAEL